MKQVIETIFSFILSLIVLAGTIFVGWIVYKELFDSNNVSTVTTENSLVSVDSGEGFTEKNEKLSIGETIKEIFNPVSPKEEINYSTESSNGKFFYEQLNDTQKIIYNGLQENKQNMKKGTFSIEFGDKFSNILGQENGGKTLGDDYQTAVDAFIHDNTDIFYVDVSKMFLNIETKKRAFNTTYNVYIKPAEGTTYYANGFNSEQDISNAFNMIESVKKSINSKLTGNKYRDIKMIHDYLVDNIEYDENDQSISPYSIYGALVEKRCVCEGYAKAFKYLAENAGIECILMQGDATNSKGEKEKHEWNAVNINDIWYLIDVTWDDPIIIGKGIVLSSVHYKHFLKGTQSFYKDHTPKYEFSENGKKFNYPTISITDY